MNPKLIQISLSLLLMCLCKAHSNEKKNINGVIITKSNRLLSELENDKAGVEAHDDQAGYEGQSNYEVLVRDKNGNPVDKNNLKNNIKIAFIDLDGTLLDDRYKLSKLNLESLAKAHNRGIKIVFATGRPPYSVSYTIGKNVKQNNLSLMPGIYLDGSIAYGPNGERIIDNYIDEKLLMDIFNFSKEKNILRCVYWYRLENMHMLEMDEYSDEDLNILPIVPNIINEEILKNTKIYKILISVNEQSLSSVLKMYQDKFSDRIYIGKRSKTYVELFHHNANKFEGVKEICKHFDISLNDALAIGDATNDREMLQGVGTSIAVQNASSKIKRCAKYVGPSNNDDAVHHILRTFCDI
ncbi:haloacid dehalogenase-like hydrolase, putative [Plasmodium chabaudi chabaudi]|uniref:Haloacid dehalogenase-like hydrolase, putative n=1 Tax=Plasmodium chabaudi chabaudi TaxID=31271 RepID=A0A4V0K4L4_PLACU|nr:haloacid dehalogenase-like hydrolase, putative [Plasmodium chabaudi chabaudi]VTZ67877.1 haloacid dehalogenase-like hydrolase, putative [Plasmodium chabaudi chabaudi]|eukprot:XP_016653507.1 haloacid dehalogenase-like hydrolase, putative [Plasmodium chabaudi chabaudi]